MKSIDPYYLSLKVGDEVECMNVAQERPNGEGHKEGGGAGFRPSLKFKIGKINKHEDFLVFWPEHNKSQGIFHNSIKIPNKTIDYEIF